MPLIWIVVVVFFCSDYYVVLGAIFIYMYILYVGACKEKEARPQKQATHNAFVWMIVYVHTNIAVDSKQNKKIKEIFISFFLEKSK